MALSLHNPPPLPWDRTLPKPHSLLYHDSVERYPWGTSSLHQHRMTVHEKAANEVLDENGRRNTVPCITLTRHRPSAIPARALSTSQGKAGLVQSSDDPQLSARKRNSSVMSADDDSRSSSPSNSSHAEGSNQLCLCQKEPKIPRPRNAFILYRQHQHAGVVAQNPGLPNPDISKIIGEQWRQLPEKIKEEWKALAEEEKTRHSQQYPDYRYRPRRSGRYSGQASISGPSPTTAEVSTTCEKCGKKPMNTVATSFSQSRPSAAGMPHMVGVQELPRGVFPVNGSQNHRMIMPPQVLASPPNSGRIRPFGEVFGQPAPLRHDPRLKYPPPPPSATQPMGAASESPDAKRRRLNGGATGVYFPARGMYHEYQFSPREFIPHSNTIQAPPLPLQQVPSHHNQHRRDPSLTLPPLQTSAQRPRSPQSSTVGQNQSSGLEAMIMSIPVLNKIKILSQISPNMPSLRPSTPPSQVRGAIIAVEGMDSASVFSMTNSLAEHLEKEGKFAVRIFGGPNPYARLHSDDKLGRVDRSGKDEGSLTPPGFLNIIYEWHQISQEMVEYVTTRPQLPTQGDEDTTMDDVGTDTAQHGNAAATSQQSPVDTANHGIPPRARTPVSAVSPKTISQTAELSLKSPMAEDGKQRHETTATPPISRIPAAALAQQEAKSKAKAIAEKEQRAREQQARDKSMPPPPLSTVAANGQSGNSTARRSTHGINVPFSPTAIPIAIVPHYQLTTVDASAISMPINDSYSPYSHWQWLATLWRGCIGPDITVAIQHPGDDSETSTETTNPGEVPSTNSNATVSNKNNQVQGHNTHAQAQNAGVRPTHPAQAQPQLQPQAQSTSQGPGVEIRLLDCRAVVVRTNLTRDTLRNDSGNHNHNHNNQKHTTTSQSKRRISESSSSSSPLDGSEAWEKAKRRVGFEVEEFLRR